METKDTPVDVHDIPYQGNHPLGPTPPPGPEVTRRTAKDELEVGTVERSIAELMEIYPGLPYGEAYQRVVYGNKELAERHALGQQERAEKSAKESREAQDRVTRERLAMLLGPTATVTTR